MNRKRRGEEAPQAERDVHSFASLKWKEEIQIASKRRKIEKSKKQEIIAAKKDVLNYILPEEGEGSEAEEDMETETVDASNSVRIVPEQKVVVKDCQTPRPILPKQIGTYFRIFAFDIFSRIQKKINCENAKMANN